MTLERKPLLEWFDRNRQRTREIFTLVDKSAWYERPIPLRNPIVFYEGHIPAFSVNTLVKGALRRPGVDEHLEVLFARGIDPETVSAADQSQAALWPDPDQVQNYVRSADQLVRDCLASSEIEDANDPMRIRALSAFTILEHEAMHQETLLYMLHRLPHDAKHRPGPAALNPEGKRRDRGILTIPAGTATLGARPEDIAFGWDNEFQLHQVEVQEFELDAFNVTNDDFLRFVESGGYAQRRWWSDQGWEWITANGIEYPGFWRSEGGRWLWRGMFDWIPLHESWPVLVSHFEAQAYARWKGRRLMTEAEFHRAAYGSPSDGERSHPWGEDPASFQHGNFGFQHFDPCPVGSYPEGRSAWGVYDLVGNGWEWTSTVFAPFDGFEPMASYPQYSADFFDGKHYVLKGASQATALPLIRRSLRNWFRPNYPYVYATFRCAG
ncbi:MAG TPA: SUMF1/EgtB/PvdO family nonheme iron enzyme [Thermoanaerobaculia bacterium]|nr:SUMF1/EgtB/PvdO family nonheme iron enzyme [Thermoanaerobaculia bacterium]